MQLARAPRPLGLVIRVLVILVSLACALASPSLAESDAEGTAKSAAPQISMGNGSENSIMVEGLEWSGRTLTFSEVTIETAGWLVLHPFQDGKPRGEIYVGATYLPAGTSKNVSVKVATAPEPSSGTRFVAMLHSDVNDDQTFDFVFVDERNVADKAVFEGTTMIAHVVAAP